MFWKPAQVDEYELSRESSNESHEPLIAENGEEVESQTAASAAVATAYSPLPPVLEWLHTPWLRPSSRRPLRPLHKPRHRFCFRGSIFRKLLQLIYAFLILLISIVVVGGVFNPSYTYLPKHYKQLRDQARSSTLPGRGNPGQEKVYIAAAIRDRHGHLAKGPWADNILELVDLLGPDNVFLSVYENDSGPIAKAALQDLEERIAFPHSLVFEEHLPLDAVPRVELPDGTHRTKRIAYLAEVRNRALKPLQTAQVRYDKLLYLNDVVFDPIDVLQLLFSTNADSTGKTDYRAACAVDFIMPFKFYDNFASRDLEGYSMGIPFFPWFTAAGEAESLQDVLDGKDAVRVRSCWGGMVAFDAKFFQPALTPAQEPITAAAIVRNVSAPYGFRSEDDLYWDASECCLIQADIQSPDPGNPGIYMNPFVRVAYDVRTLSWLWFTRRFERLYSPIHFLLSHMTGMPWHNPRRTEHPLEQVQESVWIPNANLTGGGSFEMITRIATNSGFCGKRALSVMKEDKYSKGFGWELMPTPPSS